jgi:hypothetical protein
VIEEVAIPNDSSVLNGRNRDLILSLCPIKDAYEEWEIEQRLFRLCNDYESRHYYERHKRSN